MGAARLILNLEGR